MNKNQKNTHKRDPTRLYAHKASVYALNRPDYAPEALKTFQEAVKLLPQSTVLDVGSGTGMLTRHLLVHYETVYALEPSQAMREIAEHDLGVYPGFHSLDARAEDIPLPDHSVDLIAVGQAIHWFQPEGTLAEFQRIGKPQTWLLLAHIRSIDEVLNLAMNEIFSESNGCLPRNQRPPSNQVPESYYFTMGKFETLHFPHTNKENWERFLGGIASAAYAPDVDHPLYGKFVQAARQAFENFSRNHILTWKIATEISFGLLSQSRHATSCSPGFSGEPD